MRLLLLFGLPICLFFISSNTIQQDPRKFEVQLKIQKVFFYGETLTFDEPLIVTTNPNSNKITLIDLGNGSPFGVKYFVSDRITGGTSELVHNAAFFERVQNDWNPLNPEEHREPCVLNQEKYWGIGSKNENGPYFKIDFTYNIKEI